MPKLKLGRTARIMLVAGIFVVVVVTLVTSYQQLEQEQTRLKQELSDAQLLVSKLSRSSSTEEFSESKKELEDALALYEQDINNIKTRFQQTLETDEIANTLLEIAKTTEVQITGVTATELTKDELGGKSFAVLLLTITVNGEVSNLLNFSSQLSQRLPTGLYELVDIDTEDKFATYTIRIHDYSE